jgi:hypothetical protein
MTIWGPSVGNCVRDRRYIDEPEPGKSSCRAYLPWLHSWTRYAQHDNYYRTMLMAGSKVSSASGGLSRLRQRPLLQRQLAAVLAIGSQ